jgi:hypothetical protein
MCHNRTHALQQMVPFNHLVGAHEQCPRCVEAERLHVVTTAKEIAQAGSGVDFQATNFQP